MIEIYKQIAYPTEVEGFADQLLKVQDNIPICASILSQHLALNSLKLGPEWVTEQVKDLVKCRDIILQALSPLGRDAVKGGRVPYTYGPSFPTSSTIIKLFFGSLVDTV